MKIISPFVSLLLIFTSDVIAQNSINTQPERLRQYAGYWVSSSDLNTDNVSDFPNIKMSNVPTMQNQALQVSVTQYHGGKYNQLLAELIGYDSKRKKIIALGQNQQGLIFKGEGLFSSESVWNMRDKDMLGNLYMDVEFHFNSFTDVVVEGFNESGESLWQTRFIKSNPKNKNIGIQLVSVHAEMQKAPAATLRELSRMGYSYVETFVYDDGKFYGMPPIKFRNLVEAQGLSFLGSMVFRGLPLPEELESTMKWWSKTINDHVAAGVEYLTISNNQLNSIKSITDLQHIANFYNAIGELCKEKGITFVFHNHADEFKTIDDVRIYDYLIENTNPNHVFFQADIYWMIVAGVAPIDYFKKYPNRFLSWHVKDYSELGVSGKIDWTGLFFQNGVNLPKYIVAEVENYSYPPLHSVQLAWEYLYFQLLD